jgi:glycosyltransferase involved in cell wall biosynthesis
MKKVLIFSLAYFPRHVGGAEVAIKEITDRVDDVQFDMISLRLSHEDLSEELSGKVRVHRVGFPGFLGKVTSPITALFKTWQLSRRERYDLFWVMMVTYIGGAAYAFNILHPQRKVPILLTLQEGDSTDHIERKSFGVLGILWKMLLIPFMYNSRVPKVNSKGLISIAWSLALHRSSGVQVISTYLRERAREYGYQGNIEVVPNAVDVAHFGRAFSTEDIIKAQQSLGKKEGEILLVTTSRLVTKNAVDDVIRALVLLPKTIRFIVFGIGSEGEKLKQLASKLGVEDRVLWFGHLAHDEMPRYLQACNIFIRPSRSEGMGNSFVEAMAAGLPVIATQEGGIADFLFDEKRNPDSPTTGWAVDKDAPDQIASAVLDIMNQPEKVARVVEQARSMVREKYDWDIVAKNMRDNVFLPLFAK